MTTATSPSSVRDQATAVIAARLGGFSSSLRRLEDLGDGVAADLLIALETRFGVDLDPVPGLTLGALAELVEARAALGRRILHWDDERTKRGLPLCAPRSSPRAEPVEGEVAAKPTEGVSSPTSFALRSGACRLCNKVTFINDDLRCLDCFCGPEMRPRDAWDEFAFTQPAEPAHAVRAPIAAPSDEAWRLAAAMFQRERRARLALALLSVPCGLGLIAGGVFWLQAAGLVR